MKQTAKRIYAMALVLTMLIALLPTTLAYSQVGNGSSGQDVKTMQTMLNAVMNAGLSVDGICGAKSVAAIKNFQSAYGLVTDGICGKNTWTKLEEAYNNINKRCTSHSKGTYLWPETAHPHYQYYKCANCGETFTDGSTTSMSSCTTCNPPASSSSSSPSNSSVSSTASNSSRATIRNGSQGSDVKVMQTMLNAVMNAGLSVDGICGAKSVAAIKNFQSAYGLSTDGICGKNTWAKLEAAYNSPRKCTNHSKGTYLWPETAHPHYQYYKCTNCGETFTDGSTTSMSSCSTCNPPKKAETNHYFSASYQSGIYYQKLKSCTLTGDLRKDLVNIAVSQIGYSESNSPYSLSGTESGSGNYTEYGTTMFNISASWCAMFISWCARQANIPMNIIDNATFATATDFNCTYIGRNAERTTAINYTPQPGDIIIYDWSSNGYTTKSPAASYGDHVGIVEYVEGGYVHTIEGNRGSANNVSRRSIALSSSEIKGYAVPNYTSSNPSNSSNLSTSSSSSRATIRNGLQGADVKTLQTMLNTVMNAGLSVDGICGAKTVAAIKSFQKANGLSADGVCGKNTWAKLEEMLDSGKTVKSAASSIKIGSGKYNPGTLNEGSTYSISGKITSTYRLTNVTVGIYNSDGSKTSSVKTISPNSTTYDINKVDSYIKFGQLSGTAKGTIYYFRVTATDVNGKTVRLVNNSFTVKGRSPISLESNAYKAMAESTHEVQEIKSGCVLTSYAMLVKSKLYYENKDYTKTSQYNILEYNNNQSRAYWKNINDNINIYAGTDGTIACTGNPGNNAKQYLINLLKSRPEGIVVYFFQNSSNQHAVRFCNYDSKTDTFYVSDPGSSSYKYVSLLNSSIGNGQRYKFGTTYDSIFKYINIIVYYK